MARTRIRLPILLLVLGLLAWRLLSGHGDSSAAASCVRPTPPPLATMQVEKLEKVAGDALTGPVDFVYESRDGLASPSTAWSDDMPISGLGGHGQATAGYEFRWFSPLHDARGADLFVFRSPGDAQRFVAQAASTRCRDRASIVSASRVPGGRGLIWHSPLNAWQADVYFARGSRVYRLVQVRFSSTAPPTPSDKQRMSAAVEHLACELKDARCPATRK